MSVNPFILTNLFQYHRVLAVFGAPLAHRRLACHQITLSNKSWALLLPCLSQTPPPLSPTPGSLCRWLSRESCGPLADRTGPPSPAGSPSSPLTKEDIAHRVKGQSLEDGWAETTERKNRTQPVCNLEKIFLTKSTLFLILKGGLHVQMILQG